MSICTGPDATFTKEATLLGIHMESKRAALEKFDSIANMGVESAIKAKRCAKCNNIAANDLNTLIFGFVEIF